MKGFLSILLITSYLTTWGYEKKDIKLTKYEFDRYVKPQLTSITQDYYTLMTIINPEIKPLKPIYTKLSKLKDLTDKLQLTCEKKDKIDCKESLVKMQKLLLEAFLTTHTELDFKDKNYFTADDLLVHMDLSYQLKEQIEDLQQQAEILFFLTVTGKKTKLPLQTFKRDLIQTENVLNDFLIRSSDARFRNEFMSFWSDFIRPVNNLILPQDNMKVFTIKVSDLNLRLHFLKVALTKRNKKISKQAKTLLEVIHNRWNNILKVTLRR